MMSSDKCNCSALLGQLSAINNSSKFVPNFEKNANKVDISSTISAATAFSAMASEEDKFSAEECVRRELRQLVWHANRDIWLEWRQRPEYLASGDLYSIAILCLFASIILLLMVRAIKPNQSVDDQVTLLLNSMRVRVEFEDNVRQRRKLREAKLKAVRWLAEAKMRANMRKISFRRSRSTASDTVLSADACFPAHSSHSATSPTRSLFAGAFSSRCTGSEEKRHSSESADTKTSTPSSYALSSLISQSLSRAPSIIFPVQPSSIIRGRGSNSPSRSIGEKSASVGESSSLPPPPLRLSMNNVSGSGDGGIYNLDENGSSCGTPKPTLVSTRTPIAASTPIISSSCLNLSTDDMRRASSCSSASSGSRITPRPPSTPTSVVAQSLQNCSSQLPLEQKDFWPLCPSQHAYHQQLPMQQQQKREQYYANATTTSQISRNDGAYASISGTHHERARSFHFVPQIVVTPQCDDNEEGEDDEESEQDVRASRRLRRQLQRQHDATEAAVAAVVDKATNAFHTASMTEDDEPMDDSSRSSSRPLSSSRASSSQSIDDEVSQSSFSQCDIVLDV